MHFRLREKDKRWDIPSDVDERVQLYAGFPFVELRLEKN
jgi:hypothetical protein